MPEHSQKQLTQAARILLESPFWIPELKSNTPYGRPHDDNDGDNRQQMVVLFDSWGDARIGVEQEGTPEDFEATLRLDIPYSYYLRFRTDGGGGRSPRVRNALMLLAYAIHLDNEESPIE